jgi:hypothetical protein
MKNTETQQAFDTPVLLVIFNRPDTARQVFEVIRKVKPTRFYIAADGPRPGRPDDVALCEETRAIANKVDWECDLFTLFRKENVGCGRGPSEAVTWMFEQEEAGIILEDDCLPDLSFFPYCREMLAHYRDDDRVMSVTGFRFDFLKKETLPESYFFSKYFVPWGWATWKRSWKYFDYNIASYSKFKAENRIAQVFSPKRIRDFWTRTLTETVNTEVPTWWDYQWIYTHWTQGGLCAMPKVNLVTNIGYGEGATHTLEEGSRFADLPFQQIQQIAHPEFVMADPETDRLINDIFYRPPLKHRIIRKLRKILGMGHR